MSDELSTTAAEYVLGTLDAQERAAFARRLASDPMASALMRDWERRLAPIALAAVQSIEPGPALWRGIESRIDVPASAGNVVQLKRSVARWRMATALCGSLAASLIVFAGAGFLRNDSGAEAGRGAQVAANSAPGAASSQSVATNESRPAPERPQAVATARSPAAAGSGGPAVVTASASRDNAGGVALGSGPSGPSPRNTPDDADNQVYSAAVAPVGAEAGLIVRIDMAARTLTVHRLAAEIPPGKALELWWTAPGSPPTALGRVAGQTTRIALPANIPVQGASIVASLEPEQGSPAEPSLPLVYSGKLVRD